MSSATPPTMMVMSTDELMSLCLDVGTRSLLTTTLLNSSKGPSLYCLWMWMRGIIMSVIFTCGLTVGSTYRRRPSGHSSAGAYPRPESISGCPPWVSGGPNLLVHNSGMQDPVTASARCHWYDYSESGGVGQWRGVGTWLMPCSTSLSQFGVYSQNWRTSSVFTAHLCMPLPSRHSSQLQCSHSRPLSGRFWWYSRMVAFRLFEPCRYHVWTSKDDEVRPYRDSRVRRTSDSTLRDSSPGRTWAAWW
jgi:hypothetical protein